MIKRKVRPRSLAIAFVLAGMSATLGAGPASAIVVLKTNGPNGNFYVSDVTEDPGAKCGFGAENASGFASLEWLRFRAPQVYARDITADVDTQKVQLLYLLQRRSDGVHWHTLKTATQQVKAFDDHAAPLGPMKLSATGHAGEQFRAVVRINWMRNGSVEGWVKYRIQFYAVKWTVGDPAYVYEDWCDGRAD